METAINGSRQRMASMNTLLMIVLSPAIDKYGYGERHRSGGVKMKQPTRQASPADSSSARMYNDNKHEAVTNVRAWSGHAHALDSESSAASPGGLDPAQVTAAAKTEAVASGSGKAISTLPTPQTGGATPTPTPTPIPYSPVNPADPAAYVHVSRPLLHLLASCPYRASITSLLALSSE